MPGALFLLLPHPRMPDMSFSRAEAADLAAYFETQGRYHVKASRLRSQ
jgi:hypothetical protein